jgi:hypothetical protein
MKLYREEQVLLIQQAILCNHKDAIMDENYCLNVTKPIELPSDEDIKEHIDYLITCRQNLIDNADNMPQHLLEGGCMAFESAIDNARELFLGGNNEQQ